MQVLQVKSKDDRRSHEQNARIKIDQTPPINSRTVSPPAQVAESKADELNAQASDDRGYKAFMQGDYAVANNYWTFHTEPGDPRGLHNMGVLRLKQGRVKDAERFFQYAAQDMNFGPSQAALAYLYENGEVGKIQQADGAWKPGELKPNVVLARKWKELAIAQGYGTYSKEAETIFRLDVPMPAARPQKAPRVLTAEAAEQLRAGIAAYKQKQYKQAKKLLEAIATDGDVNAQYYLGLAHFNDKPAVAHLYARWFREAAVQGHPDAQSYYGYCLETGSGAPTDYEKAKDYYEKAASQGSVSAIFRIGQLYEHGKGVPVDEKRAEAMYRVAIELGHKGAQDALKYMHNRGDAHLRGQELSDITFALFGVRIYIKNFDPTPAVPGNPWDDRVESMQKQFRKDTQDSTDAYIIENFM